ncbi:MAG: 16S rRNA (guanine(966)-N(2))-methyltransferase RsmD [Nitrospira sp.]|nr:16S rRNA (guanine(966)-N(2))-methyltransferase RsmD [Nitrospira sp.]
MRVIAGTQKGRRLHGPKGPDLRPTADRVKEALFSILGARVAGARFLDLFAGTGAIGIEALSRGAASVMFVESSPSAGRILKTNLAACGLEAKAHLYLSQAETFLRSQRAGAVAFDIIFADPPYQFDPTATLWPILSRTTALAPGGLLVFEHATKLALPPAIPSLSLLRQYHYGDTTLSVFECTAQDGAVS